jgi:hypothetical protein
LDRTARVGWARGAGWSPELVFHGGASTELIEINAPRVKSSGAWVWDKLHDMSNPPRVLAGLGVLGVAVAMAKAGQCGGAHRRAAFQPKQGLRSTTSSAKRTRGTCSCSPRAWSALDGHARVSVTLTGGGDETMLAGRAAAGVVWLLGFTDRHGVVL